jgi:hypothetical protein
MSHVFGIRSLVTLLDSSNAKKAAVIKNVPPLQSFIPYYEAERKIWTVIYEDNDVDDHSARQSRRSLSLNSLAPSEIEI